MYQKLLESRNHIAWALCLPLIFWVDVAYVLHVEWSINEQYQYGFIVPLLCAYLIYLRMDGAPKPSTALNPTAFYTGIALICVLWVPIKIILSANPEWRLAYWIQAFLAYGITLLVTYRIGGLSWLKHYTIALAMMLFAVPWPSALENTIVLGLMDVVAESTVEIINLMGITAIQNGNLINLMIIEGGRVVDQIPVGVEEACSGVRSLQSTLMGAYFIGELLRLSPILRVMLVILGSVTSFLLNISRTLYLTWTAYDEGPDALESVHDAAGNFVAIGAFVILLAIAYLLKRFLQSPTQKQSEQQAYKPLSHDHMRPAFLGIIAVLLSYLVVLAWYGQNITEGEIHETAVNWDKIHSSLVHEEIPPATRAILRYTEGESVRWQEMNERWMVYFFSWEEGRISPFAGVHRPDVCLPSAGFQLVEKLDTFIWSKNDLAVEIQPYIFRGNGRFYYVYFSVWDDAQSEPIPLVTSASERLNNALEAKRITGRKSLQIIHTGFTDYTVSVNSAVEFLDNHLSVN